MPPRAWPHRAGGHWGQGSGSLLQGGWGKAAGFPHSAGDGTARKCQSLKEEARTGLEILTSLQKALSGEHEQLFLGSTQTPSPFKGHMLW